MTHSYTDEYTGDSTDLVYLRARYYAPEMGRFLIRDTWEGDGNTPMSFNRWMYVDGNPINYTDATGMLPCVVDLTSDKWTGIGWTNSDIGKRVDEAEKYVYRTSDPMDTYTAAGIAIQCAGTNLNTSFSYSGIGIAQITAMQALTAWGEPIYQWDWWNGCYVYEREDVWPYKYKIENGHNIIKIRGYGLRRPEDGEVPLDPNNAKDAVILMKREIQLVTTACGPKCTATDIYIAAALAQNGPGFSYKEIGTIPKYTSDADILLHGTFRRWNVYFNAAARVNTKTQLNRFILVVNELGRRRWIVPYIRSDVIDSLK